ncbi:hypothetical protein WJX73_002334 [Symbiochloris irregularis]|uniref:FAD-binding FR-type domain-containing protein n=1 Tax=Symbiochloris irregularis TaxID=706552 RepID=A0AAW1PRW0_9CHLO
MINAAALFLFFPIPRNSFLQHLFRTDFATLIKYHRWLGHLTLITTAIHGVLYYVLWGVRSEFASQFRTWQQHGISNLAGSLSFFFGLILWVSSFEYIRRNYFEVFYRLHIVGALGFYILGFMHYDGLYWYSAPGLMLYLLDLTFRLAQWMNVSIVTGSILSEDVLALHLMFTPETKLTPNSFVFISCPDASRSEWHPFTLSLVQNSTSPDRPATATIFMKSYGKWVKSVIQRITDKGSALVKLDGPYGGASSVLHGDCKVAVIFAGGIGVTPMLGLLSALRERRHEAEFHGSITAPSIPQKVVFVWTCRNAQEFDLLDDLLLSESRIHDSWLDIRLHCTGSMTWTKGGIDKDSPTLKALNSQGNGTTQEGQISLESTVKASGKAFPPMERPEVKLASPFFLKPSLLQGYGIGYPLWGLVHVLGFLGGWFVPLVIEYYSSLKYAVYADGGIYWLTNTLEMIALVIGTMGMPALIIFPIYLWRRRKALRSLKTDISMRPSGYSAPHPKDSPSSMEAGTGGIAFSKGRPDIRSILKDVQLQYNSLEEINVFAAGPASMVRDVKVHSTDLNHFMGKNGAQLVYEIETFAL